jgi:hypothetical protein
MIYKRFGNPHIKLWNNELERLFKFKSLLKIEGGEGQQDVKVKNVDDLAQGHLKDIMSQKILLPIQKVIENQEDDSKASFSNPIL